MSAPAPAPPHPYRWAMLAGVCFVYFSFGATTAAIAPLVGRITEELALTHTQMGSVLGAWQLAFIGAAIPCGKLIDRIGVRRGLAVGALVIALSGVLRGLATDYVSLLLAVAVFGIGGPFVSVGVPKVIGQWFTGRERGLAMGLTMVGNSFGLIGALSLTSGVGLAVTGGDWRTLLMAYGGIALLAALVWTVIGGRRAARAAEAAAGAQAGHGTGGVRALLALPSVRTVLMIAVGAFLFGHSLSNWLPEILRTGGMDAATAGYWASLPIAIGIGAALVFPRLAVPARRLAILAGLFLAQIATPLLILWGDGAVLACGLVLQGLVRGALSTIVLLVMMELREVDPQRIGTVGGMYFTAGEIGGVLGPLSLGLLRDLIGGFTAGLIGLALLAAWQLFLLARLRSALR
ncbi:MAG: MFS transporter [Alphaproteobacteria bacterium]|nr:MFS transporter [Alphaproteobacteria bacterium]